MQVGGGLSESNQHVRDFSEIASSLKRSAVTYRLGLDDGSEQYHLANLRRAVMADALNLIRNLSREQNIKWYFSLATVFHRAINPNETTDPAMYFVTEPTTSTSSIPLERQLLVALRRLCQEVDTFESHGSGWILDHFVFIDIHVTSYDPLRASAYLPLPNWIVKRKAVLNIRNTDRNW